MPLYTTPDGRYTVAWQTPGEGDGNSVVYDRGPDLASPWPGAPVWDRFSHEAGLGEVRAPVVPPPDVPTPVPVPVTPPPEPAVTNWRREPIRVTKPSDGEFAPRMYSYWSNAFVTGNKAFVFAGHVDANGAAPRFFEVNLTTGAVDPLGPLIGFVGETEGWYWSRDGWIYLIDGPRLRKVSPFTNEAPVVFDISEMYPGCDLWQAHSSDDGRVHSATVRDAAHPMPNGKYPYIATVVCRDGTLMPPFPAQGDLDESHVSGDGRFVIIEESDNDRVINLESKETRHIRDAEGALAHIDCGPDYMVGEADKPDPGCAALYRLDRPLTPGNKVTLFLTTNMGHLSVKADRCLLSDNTHLSLVSLNGGGVVNLFAHGGDIGGYDFQPKANLDHTGRVATYMIHQSGRYDVYLAVLPA